MLQQLLSPLSSIITFTNLLYNSIIHPKISTIILIISILEFCNWINYIIIYHKLLKPQKKIINQQQINSLINAIKNTSKNELENILKTSISYDINKFDSISDEVDISTLSLNEINNIIRNNILCNQYLDKINDIREIIENKLNLKFSNLDSDNNKYIVYEWGKTYFNFTFNPLILTLIIKTIFNFLHYMMIYIYKFNYKVVDNNSIGFLYNNYDPTKKTLLFIHGFGFSYFPYFPVLLKLSKTYNIIIVILPNISYFLYSSQNVFLLKNKLNNLIYDFLISHNYNNIVIISHSFGSLISSILFKDKRSSLFQKNISIDPIYFYKDYCKIHKHAENPCYSKNNIFQYLFDKLINFLIYNSIYLKNISYRYFCGPTYWIYDSTDVINDKFIFIFHKYDYVVSAETVYDNIKDFTKSFMIDTPDSSHGNILFNSHKYHHLINLIENNTL